MIGCPVVSFRVRVTMGPSYADDKPLSRSDGPCRESVPEPEFGIDPAPEICLGGAHAQMPESHPERIDEISEPIMLPGRSPGHPTDYGGYRLA
jgi:hypothetical protein